MTNIVYQYILFARLEPRTTWKGGRLTDTDLVTLDEAARYASQHAQAEITTGDVLRAAGRGEIRLRAIVHYSARIKKHDGGVYCNAGEPNENVIPKGAIPTLPLSACQQLANAGRASWRTIDGFVLADEQWMRYDIAALEDGEPNFQTVIDDCRVIGYDVHALADAYIEDEMSDVPEFSASNAGHGRERKKADALALELDELLDSMKASGQRITAGTVMPKLKERAGQRTSCIKSDTAGGVKWEDVGGNEIELTAKSLQKRIDRWRAKTPA